MRNIVFNDGEIPSSGCVVFIIEYVYSKKLQDRFIANLPLEHLTKTCSSENAYLCTSFKRSMIEYSILKSEERNTDCYWKRELI